MSINVFWLPLILLLSFILGFAFRSRQLKKSKKRIVSLENEMLNNHAEILNLQQELAALRKENAANHKSRVVLMNESSPEEGQESKDVSQRKKIGK